MADWPGRPGVCPWMLINLVLALRGLGREADAGRVSRHALGLPADSCTPLHGLWLSLDELIEGRSGEASARLDGIDASSLRPTNRYLHGLALILATASSTPPRRLAAAQSFRLAGS